MSTTNWECMMLIVTVVMMGFNPIAALEANNPTVRLSDSHSTTFGRMEADDVLLYQYENNPTSISGVYVTQIFEYRNPQKVIHLVSCYDLWTDGTGPTFRLLSGGVESNFVRINVTSQLDRGYHIIIKVYGTNSSSTSTVPSQNNFDDRIKYSMGLTTPFLPACVALTTMAVLFCVIVGCKLVNSRRVQKSRHNLTRVNLPYDDRPYCSSPWIKQDTKHQEELTQLGVNQGFLKDDKDTVVYACVDVDKKN